ncbi:hypothetical protein CERSUDRAFT_101131 [Gelatoporia subvermispora B]|uniref:Uncharacterized protein n=1 Tax=Ceriporiopsis subvermispora (strain B) TaxID=914234 RepID=M2QXI6_CERS8|nr:hypothetical protein CERSUDRAFT_101131 [Gelatoporia subvermispora B]
MRSSTVTFRTYAAVNKIACILRYTDAFRASRSRDSVYGCIKGPAKAEHNKLCANGKPIQAV